MKKKIEETIIIEPGSRIIKKLKSFLSLYFKKREKLFRKKVIKKYKERRRKK